MKNLLLLLALLITTSTVFSQLHVSPNGATDSYVFVKDEVLFVENGINLEENNTGSIQASIYLREGSQLIQGSGSTLNSGDGYISIYQKVDSTSNYHYTFWNSPVGNQNLGGGSAGNKKAGVSRFYDINTPSLTDSDQVATTGGWNGSSTTDPITISTRWIYKMTSGQASGGESNWIWVGGADNVEPHYGFIMKGVSPGPSTISQIYDFRGRPNNGNIDVPVGSGEQWTLSGNPYPSAIDLMDFFWDNNSGNPGDPTPGGTGLTEILFWDEPKNSEYSHFYVDKSGGYGAWIPGPGTGDTDPGLYTQPPYSFYSAAGGGGTATGAGPYVYRRYAPVGQGFVLQTNLVTPGNITFKNSYRIFKKIGEVSEFRSPEEASETGFRNPGDGPVISINPGDPDPDPINIGLPQLRINVSMNEEYARQLLLAFHENSTKFYDIGLDAHHPMDAPSEAYFQIEENGNMEPFVIQTLPFGALRKIPIAFKLSKEMKFAVKAIEEINFDFDAFLWDSVGNTFKKFTGEEVATELLPAGTYENRFYIVFRNQRDVLENSEGTLLKDEIRNSVSFFQNNPYKQMEVSNPEGYDIKSAFVYDMSGKLVVNKTNIGTDKKFNISTSNLSDGVYLIKLTTSENIDIDYKMIIYNK